MSKTKAQTKTLWDELDELLVDTVTYLDGELTTNLDAVSAAIDAGSDEPEDEVSRAKLALAWKAAGDLHAALVNLYKCLPPYLGRYAGCASLSDPEKCIAAFHDKITADNEHVESAGFTKFSSFVPGGPVSTQNLVGNRTVTQINALSPAATDAYVVTNSGTLTTGSLSVSAGDLVAYSGSAWTLVVAGVGGFVAAGTKATLSTTVALLSPYTDATDDGKVMRFDGTSNTGTDVSNTGNGTFAVLNTDPQGLSIDISHIETMTLRCTSTQQAGRERFTMSGASVATRPWKDGGSGEGSAHAPVQGSAVNGFSADLANAREIQSVDGQNGNILTNGGFEATVGSGTTKITGWTISSGDSNLTTGTAVYYKGLQALKATGNFTMYQLIGTKVTSLRPYALEAIVHVHASMTAGTVTLKVKDDTTTHASFTQSCDTTTLTDATWTKLTYTAAVLPKTIGKNLRVEIELTGYAGSEYLLIDEVKLAPMALMDGGRAVAIFGGSTNWQLNDCATGATTCTNGGTRQRNLNRHQGKYVKHGAGSYWTDGV